MQCSRGLGGVGLEVGEWVDEGLRRMGVRDIELVFLGWGVSLLTLDCEI